MTHVNDNGDIRVFGFTDVTISAPDEGAIAGAAVQTRTLGASFLSADGASAVGVGYNDHRVAHLRNDAAVIGDPFDF